MDISFPSCIRSIFGIFVRRFTKFIVRLIIVFPILIGGVVNAETLLVTRVENIPDQLIGSAIIKAAMAKIGIELTFVDLPAKRALLTSISGEADAELQRIYEVGQQNSSLIRVPTSYTYIDAVAFALTPNIKIDGWNSLKAYTVTRANGALFAESGLKGHDQVVIAADNEAVFKILKIERAELGISTLHYGKFITNKLGIKVFPLKPILERIPLYFYLHKKNAHLVKRIDAVFSEMKASGELERIRSIHFERTLLITRKLSK